MYSDLGANFYSQEPLCRNYSPFLTDDVEEVDELDAGTHAHMQAWFVSFGLCIAGMYLNSQVEDVPAGIEFCTATLETYGCAYGYDGFKYYRGAYTYPGWAGFGGEQYILQRMLLAWQDWEAESYPEECTFPTGQTIVTKSLNKMIRRAVRVDEVYKGGPGVLVRALDGLEDDENLNVVPASFWVNDIFTPSGMYPGSGAGSSDASGKVIGNPMCPHDESDGFVTFDDCAIDPVTSESDPWKYAQVAAVINSSLPHFYTDWNKVQEDDWYNGVFYPYDANSVDKRCYWIPEANGYDCPGGWLDGMTQQFTPDPSKVGAGASDGKGCHFEPNGVSTGPWTEPSIDQTDVVGGEGFNLVSSFECECNSVFQADNWESWVATWIDGATPKPGFEYQGWFKGGLAPSWAGDIAACWVRSPRDMVMLQNQLYWKREYWNNQLLPLSDWSSNEEAWSLRTYWGWNEVPVDRELVSNPMLWDAVMVKLPAAACGLTGSNLDSISRCLDDSIQIRLEQDLNDYVQRDLLRPGEEFINERPGSYMVLARETMDMNQNWRKEFFCENLVSPNSWYQIRYNRIFSGELIGACFIDTVATSNQKQLSSSHLEFFI